MWEEPLLPAGLRPPGLCQPGLQEAPQGSQAPEVAVEAGLCPCKELWFEESRCPVDGWDPHGSNADAQLQTQQILLGTGAESLKRHRGGGGGGMNRPTGSSPSSTREQAPFHKESTGPLGERQAPADYDPQTQMGAQEKQSNPPENPEGGARRERRGKTLHHWFTITGLANISHSEEGAAPSQDSHRPRWIPGAGPGQAGPRQEPSPPVSGDSLSLP